MTALAQPIAIFLFGIGGGFLIPILYKIGYGWLHAGFAIALSGLTLTSVVSLFAVVQGGEAIEILTAGAAPPISINLRFGLAEGAFSVSVNIMAMLLACALWDQLKKNYVALLLFLILVMGINGMILTRDLFNLFVFLEIVSIGTYGLLGLVTSRAGIQAAFKYVLATVVASTLFLLGAVLIYYVTGHLNIDLVIEARADLTGPIGAVAVMMILACLLIELKPYPANGWGLDVYETTPPALAAFLSVCASAGMLFAVYKLLPLFENSLGLVVALSALTFLASNLIGLRQDKVQRLLGYSSVGQMALGVLALAVLTQIGATDLIPLVVFGLFLNHLLAKAGLFCLVAATGASDLREALGLGRRPLIAGGLALLIVAICALPPFPGFWAKWELIMQLASAERFALIVIILAGSLAETTYLFRWYIRAMTQDDTRALPEAKSHVLLPVVAMAVLLVGTGIGMAVASGAEAGLIFLPLAVAAGVLVIGLFVPQWLQGVAMLGGVAWVALQVMPPAIGIAGLFADLLLAGGLVIAAGGLANGARRPVHYPLMAMLLLSIQSLLRTEYGLTFYVAWEFITIASFFLIAQRGKALPETLRFIVFSMLAAFMIMAGFAMIAGQAGSRGLEVFSMATPAAVTGFALVAAGFLVKAAAIGVHIWLPPAYGEAPDDVTAMLSGVVSKIGIFGLLMTAYAAGQSALEVDFAYLLAWIGMATTVLGAFLALCQTDLKRLLAYSSMSQLGYIVTAIALMSHLGWVTALYVVANHMMVKGILFLAAAAIILRSGTRDMAELGGLARRMPLTFAVVALALLSMSGLPPLMGFGGKWLLLSAMMDKGWTMLVAAGLLATFLGLWYMLRVLVLFFGPERSPAREAPVMILIPQALLVGGILVLSLFPKLLMGPVSDAIDPQFAATLVWEGQSLETIYGLWDPAPIMLMSVAAAAGLAVVWLVASRLASKSLRNWPALFAARPLMGANMPRPALATWQAIVQGIEALADGTRRIYTGNGQFYALLVLAYFLFLYFATTLGAGG